MLNDTGVRATLADGFVNAWVLARELDAIEAGAADDELKQLCGILRSHYGYPVDSVVVSPTLQLLGHVTAKGPIATDARGYAEWLRRAAAGDERAAEAFVVPQRPPPEPAPDVTLRADRPEAEVLDALRQEAFGVPTLRYYTIDATAFATGGRLRIGVRVGRGKAAGRFELHAFDSRGAPLDLLTDLAPGGDGELTCTFSEGQRFVLLARPGADAVEGDGNAFVATLRVVAK